MIIRSGTNNTTTVITQNDHAKLSGLMAAHWGNQRFARPQPFASLLRAAQYHDLGWLDREISPAFSAESGEALNFLSVPNDPKHLDAFTRSHEWLTRIDPYAALLVTKHRTGVYQARYGTLTQPSPPPVRAPSEPLKKYVEQSEAEQAKLLPSVDRQVFDVNYKLLQVWDLLSLWICCNATPQTITVAPVPNGYGEDEETAVTFTPNGSERVAVQPYPFDRPSLECAVVYRQLPHQRFADEDAFYRAYYGAAPRVHIVTFFDSDAIA